MQISVKLHCNQSCKSHRFSIWASSFLCTCLENGVWRRRVGFRERARGRGRAQGGEKDNKRWVWQEGGGYEKHSKKKKRRALIPYSGLNSFFFPLGFRFKNSYHDQNCSAMRDFQRWGFFPPLLLMRRMERMERRSLMRQRRMNEYSEGLWAFVHNRPRSNGRQEKTRRAAFFISVQKNNVGKLFQTTINSFFFSLSLLLKKYSIKETNPTIITVYTAILSACLGEYKCGDQTLVESKKKKNCRKEQWVPPKRAVLKLSGLYKKGC